MTVVNFGLQTYLITKNLEVRLPPNVEVLAEVALDVSLRAYRSRSGSRYGLGFGPGLETFVGTFGALRLVLTLVAKSESACFARFVAMM